ncbi:hypothetical protein BBJ28_00003086 [Nothophytophthora sp. Chile5]|nr:hypothetical protein BBJ28_00003086 [Nothophytophthora sp. Chile5]
MPRAMSPQTKTKISPKKVTTKVLERTIRTRAPASHEKEQGKDSARATKKGNPNKMKEYGSSERPSKPHEPAEAARSIETPQEVRALDMGATQPDKRQDGASPALAEAKEPSSAQDEGNVEAKAADGDWNFSEDEWNKDEEGKQPVQQEMESNVPNRPKASGTSAVTIPTTGDASYLFRLCFESEATANAVYQSYLNQDHALIGDIKHGRTIRLKPGLNAEWDGARKRMFRPTAAEELPNVARRLHIFGLKPELSMSQVERKLEALGYPGARFTAQPGTSDTVERKAEQDAACLHATYGAKQTTKI